MGEGRVGIVALGLSRLSRLIQPMSFCLFPVCYPHRFNHNKEL